MECERRNIVGIEREALIELDMLRTVLYIPPTPQAPRQPPTPALDALSPERREELSGILTKMADVWMNVKNDALGLYNHVTHAVHTTVPEKAVFVTSDKNFKKYSNVLKRSNWERLQALGFPGYIMEPQEAVAYLQSVMGVSPTETE